MLKTIGIKNFQSHKKTLLKLSPGVNVIVGRSTTGKSAIVRALRWLITNRPSGAPFRSHFATMQDNVTVMVRTARHRVSINRTPRGKTNYDVDSNSDEHHAFSGIGRAVPDEVSAALNLEDINLQTQLEPHFLITSSPRDFSAAIDKVTQTEIIDDAVKALNRTINDTQNKIQQQTETVESTQAQLQEYHDYEEVQAAVKKATRIEARIVVMSADRLRVKSIKYELSQIEVIPPEAIEEADKHIKQAGVYTTEALYLADVSDKVAELGHLIDQISLLRATTRGITRALAKATKYDKIMRRKQSALDLLQMLGDEQATYTRMERNKVMLERDIAKVLDSLDVCPTCGSEL